VRGADRFRISRQRPLPDPRDPSGANEGNVPDFDPGDPEPAAIRKIGYMIVTTPPDLVRDNQSTDDATLSTAVSTICRAFSQGVVLPQGKPDPAGPH
jgi:hypothetical protein